MELPEIEKILIKSDDTLSDEEEAELKNWLENIIMRIQNDEKFIANIGRLLDYNRLKKQGFTKEQIAEFSLKDEEIMKFTQDLVNQHKIDHDYMFGYPANMQKDSYVIRYLRYLESKLYFTNSCGNAYSQGNYRMNNAKQELEVIEKVKENLGLNMDDFWGYITMGGTEGNMWGIREGFNNFPNGILYYSDASHYSVTKMSDMIRAPKHEIIESTNEKINIEKLIERIKINYQTSMAPAILLLTFGTTTLGSIDDIDIICERLNELGIPHYIHVDAALYGGIPNNQISSPAEKFRLLNSTDIDSISISFHKYVGSQKSNGVLLSKSKKYDKFIDYIGNNDVTFCGSRDFPTFSLQQRIEELYHRTNPDVYIENVRYFEKLLIDNNIYYIKGIEFGNIFVINKPNEEICKKYQLATFMKDGIEYAHVIIFPYHNKKIMNELVNELVYNKVSIQRKREEDNNGKN
ncbi:MAG: hypothetical protein IKX00_01535 [Bacilli bacterium]|nr:hypothetical protein [Bacilli bacterium]